MKTEGDETNAQRKSHANSETKHWHLLACYALIPVVVFLSCWPALCVFCSIVAHRNVSSPFVALYFAEYVVTSFEETVDRTMAKIPDISTCSIFNASECSISLLGKCVRCEKSMFRPGLWGNAFAAVARFHLDVMHSVLKCFFTPTPPDCFV